MDCWCKQVIFVILCSEISLGCINVLQEIVPLWLIKCFYILVFMFPRLSFQNRCPPSFSSSNLIPSTRLCNSLPLLSAAFVIPPLLTRSCLYSPRNWRKCCGLDRIDTPIVIRQSASEMSLLCREIFHLCKVNEDKK